MSFELGCKAHYDFWTFPSARHAGVHPLVTQARTPSHWGCTNWHSGGRVQRPAGRVWPAHSGAELPRLKTFQLVLLCYLLFAAVIKSVCLAGSLRWALLHGRAYAAAAELQPPTNRYERFQLMRRFDGHKVWIFGAKSLRLYPRGGASLTGPYKLADQAFNVAFRSGAGVLFCALTFIVWSDASSGDQGPLRDDAVVLLSFWASVYALGVLAEAMLWYVNTNSYSVVWGKARFDRRLGQPPLQDEFEAFAGTTIAAIASLCVLVSASQAQLGAWHAALPAARGLSQEADRLSGALYYVFSVASTVGDSSFAPSGPVSFLVGTLIFILAMLVIGFVLSAVFGAFTLRRSPGNAAQPRAAERPRVRRAAVVIPARNEAVTICQVIRSAREEVAKLAEEIEIIVVADRCTDRTADLAAAEGARVVVAGRGTRGLGDVYRIGMRAATSHEVEMVVHLDVHDTHQIPVEQDRVLDDRENLGNPNRGCPERHPSVQAFSCAAAHLYRPYLRARADRRGHCSGARHQLRAGDVRRTHQWPEPGRSHDVALRLSRAARSRSPARPGAQPPWQATRTYVLIMYAMAPCRPGTGRSIRPVPGR
jgi:hypothetical protein